MNTATAQSPEFTIVYKWPRIVTEEVDGCVALRVDGPGWWSSRQCGVCQDVDRPDQLWEQWTSVHATTHVPVDSVPDASFVDTWTPDADGRSGLSKLKAMEMPWLVNCIECGEQMVTKEVQWMHLGAYGKHDTCKTTMITHSYKQNTVITNQLIGLFADVQCASFID